MLLLIGSWASQNIFRRTIESKMATVSVIIITIIIIIITFIYIAHISFAQGA